MITCYIGEIQVLGVRDQGSGGTLTTNDYPLITDNAWGLDINGTFQGAGGVGGLLAVLRSDCVATNSSLVTRSSSLYFPTYDANGNVSEYVTTNGEVVAHYDYSPFGETLIESGDLADSFTHRFSTKPWCPVTGLYEYQMRKYRPEIGRWMSRDPMEENGALNLYLLSANSPVCTYDILGNISYTECFSYCVAYSATQLANVIKVATAMVMAAEAMMEFPAGSKEFNLGIETVTSLGNRIYIISSKIASSDGTCAFAKSVAKTIGEWAKTSGTFTGIPRVRNPNLAVRRFAKYGRTILRVARGGLVILSGAAAAIEAFCATRCLSCEARDDFEQLMEEHPEEFMLGLEDLLIGEW